MISPRIASVDHESQSTAAIFLEQDESKIIESKTSTVYTGILKQNAASVDVMCKMAFRKKHKDILQHEFMCYEHLREVQGEIIPTCYGLFKGEMDGDNILCLVLEYGGERLRYVMQCMNWDFKKKAIAYLEELHKREIAHGDWNERNILVKKGTEENLVPMIVDLGFARIGHDCEAHNNNMRIVFDEVTPEDFPCDELYYAARGANAWIPATFEYLRVDVPIAHAGLSADELAEQFGPDPRWAKENGIDVVAEARKALEARKTMLAYRAACKIYIPR